jgi:putative transposase
MSLVAPVIKKLHQQGFPLKVVCQVLGVPRSTYHYHLSSPPSLRSQEDQRLGELVENLFRRHKRRFGVRRITLKLQTQGETCGMERVARLMKKRGLVAIQPKSFQPKTTQSRHKLGYNDHLLMHRKIPTQINKVLLGDITYLPLVNGKFAYLAVLMDWFSRKIVGWSHASHMREELVLSALRMAIGQRQPPVGLIHHTDRGGQYAGKEYRRMLKQAGMKQSMSRADNCYDNAFMESYFGSMKRELELQPKENLQTSKAEIAEYIQYYNEERIHSSLRYQTPCEYERASMRRRRKP